MLFAPLLLVTLMMVGYINLRSLICITGNHVCKNMHTVSIPPFPCHFDFFTSNHIRPLFKQFKYNCCYSLGMLNSFTPQNNTINDPSSWGKGSSSHPSLHSSQFEFISPPQVELNHSNSIVLYQLAVKLISLDFSPSA